MNAVEQFRASLKRCLAAPDFLLDFYGTFMDSSDEIREKFRDTDMKRQTQVLADSLWSMTIPDPPAYFLPASLALSSLAALGVYRAACGAGKLLGGRSEEAEVAAGPTVTSAPSLTAGAWKVVSYDIQPARRPGPPRPSLR